MVARGKSYSNLQRDRKGNFRKESFSQTNLNKDKNDKEVASCHYLPNPKIDTYTYDTYPPSSADYCNLQ